MNGKIVNWWNASYFLQPPATETLSTGSFQNGSSHVEMFCLLLKTKPETWEPQYNFKFCSYNDPWEYLIVSTNLSKGQRQNWGLDQPYTTMRHNMLKLLVTTGKLEYNFSHTLPSRILYFNEIIQSISVLS